MNNLWFWTSDLYPYRNKDDAYVFWEKGSVETAADRRDDNLSVFCVSGDLIHDCNDHLIDLRTVDVGFKCRNTKGKIYERVAKANFGEAWKGPDGLIWSDIVDHDTLYDAFGICKKLGGKLPTREDFELGEANGFRKVLPNMKDQWYWSSSPHPVSDDIPYEFNGNGGDDNVISGHTTSQLDAIRCVAR
jgi:hypothetical protein